jgi:hypothetical protein
MAVTRRIYSFLVLIILAVGARSDLFAADQGTNTAMFSGALFGTFRTILTAKDTGARLTEQSVTAIGKMADSSIATVFIDPAHQFQTILGFGGAFTEAAAVTWLKMSPANQQADPDITSALRLGIDRATIEAANVCSYKSKRWRVLVRCK